MAAFAIGELLLRFAIDCDIIEKKGCGEMETRFYEVVKIEGEYAYIKDGETGEEIFIAMFLLPDGVDIGTKLKYEMLEYEIID